MSAAAPPPAPAPRKPRRRWIRRALAIVLVLGLAVVGAAVWVLTTPEGAKLVLGRVQGALGQGTRIEGIEGYIGGRMKIATIEIRRAGLYVLVEGFEMQTAPLEHLRARLRINDLVARRVIVRTASSKEAAKIPLSFEPPYALRIDAAKVGELRIGNLDGGEDFVVSDLFLRGSGGKHAWSVDEGRARTAYGEVSLAGTLGTDSPFPREARAEASGHAPGRDWSTKARAGGTLKAIVVDLDGLVSGQRATAHAQLEPFSDVPVRALTAHAEGVDLSKLAAAPATRLTLDANLSSDGKRYAGPVKVLNAQPGPWDRKLLPFASAAAQVAVDAQRVDVTGLAVALAGGGNLGGRATLTKHGVEAQLSVAGIDLAALDTRLQKTSVSGRIAVSGDSALQRFNASLKETRFALEGRGALTTERVDLESVIVRTGGGAIDAKGGLALEGRKDFRFEGRAQHFDPAAFVKTTAGDLNFTFALAGNFANGPSGEARVEIAPSRYAGQGASGRVFVAGDRTRIANADVQLTLGEARIGARGAFGRRGDTMDVSVHAPNLSVLARPFGVTAAGSADLQARLTGTFDSPAGNVTLTGANLVLPSDVYVKQLSLRAEAGTAADSPIDAQVRASAVAFGKDNPPTPFAESIEATLKGTRRAHRLEAVAQMTRDNRLEVALDGGLDEKAKDPAWSGRVERIALSGRGAFALAAPAALFASAQRVELGDATLRGDWGEARLAVTRWTPGTLDLKGTSPGVQIQNLARSLRLGTVPRSTLVVAGDWDLHAAETLQGTASLRRVSGDLRIGDPPLPLGLKELEVKLEAARGRARATLLATGDRVGRIQGEGAGAIVRGASGWELAKDAPVSGRFDADIADLSTVAAWVGPDARAGGRLAAHVAVSGTAREPRLAGTARAQDLALREPATGFELEHGEVQLRLDGQSVTLERLQADTPWHLPQRARTKLAGVKMPAAGSITAEGSLDLEKRSGGLRVRATQVPATQLQSRFLALSGEARLQSTGEGILVTGDLKADAAWIGALDSPPPSVAEDVVVIRPAQPEPERKGRAKEAMRIDARFALGDHAFFEGRGLDTRLTGELRVEGDPATGLRATGAIRTVEGIYKGYGQRLAIERGVLQFAGPVDNPQLNVLALRKGLPVEAGVEVLGSVARPKIRLVSTPDVPEPEKLSWLVLGRGPSELGPGDASVLVQAAASMLGHGDSGDIAQKFGLDEVKIGRADTNSVLGVLPQSTVAGRTGTASAAEVVSVGRKLGRNIHLTYEQGLADAEGTLKIAYDVSHGFQVLARAGYLPGLDAVWRWTFP